MSARPRVTRDPVVALKRLAAHLGWEVEASGRMWVLRQPEPSPYFRTRRWNPMKADRCLGTLIGIATSKFGDRMPYREVAAICRLSVKPLRPGEMSRWWWTAEIRRMTRAAES